MKRHLFVTRSRERLPKPGGRAEGEERRGGDVGGVGGDAEEGVADQVDEGAEEMTPRGDEEGAFAGRTARDAPFAAVSGARGPRDCRRKETSETQIWMLAKGVFISRASGGA